MHAYCSCARFSAYSNMHNTPAASTTTTTKQRYRSLTSLT